MGRPPALPHCWKPLRTRLNIGLSTSQTCRMESPAIFGNARKWPFTRELPYTTQTNLCRPPLETIVAPSRPGVTPPRCAGPSPSSASPASGKFSTGTWNPADIAAALQCLRFGYNRRQLVALDEEVSDFLLAAVTARQGGRSR